jgi:hypothetical protein
MQAMQEQLMNIRRENHQKEEQRQMERYSKEQADLANARAELETRQRREEEELRHDRYRDEYELVHLKREIARIKHEEESLKMDRLREEQAKLSKDSDELARIRRDQDERKREKEREEEAEYRKNKAELERRIRAEEDEKRDKATETEAKAKAALAELERIHAAKQKREEEERIRRELELKKLEEERKAQQEAKRKEKEAEEVIAAFKAKEAERVEKEKQAKEAQEKEFQRLLQERLIKSGLDEKAIEAIMKEKKVKQEKQEKQEDDDRQITRPTYTRMSLRHLDIQTLLYHKIDFEHDAVSPSRHTPNYQPHTNPFQDPGYVLIKRWVPEWEQKVLWEHTRTLRQTLVIEQRPAKHADHVVMLEPKGHRRKHSTEYQWVREKSRTRSKSPSLLLYLAGGRPR